MTDPKDDFDPVLIDGATWNCTDGICEIPPASETSPPVLDLRKISERPQPHR